jgi:hypothetical protein
VKALARPIGEHRKIQPRPKSRWRGHAPLVMIVAGVCLVAPLSAQSRLIGWAAQSFDFVEQGQIVQVSQSYHHTVALRSDGTVFFFCAWGNNQWGQCDIPALPMGLSYVQIGAAWTGNTAAHSVDLRSNRSIVAWGNNDVGQCNVPPLPIGLTYVQIAPAFASTIGRRSDGSVIAWGDNAYGQCNIPPLPMGVTYVDIKGGNGAYGIGLRSDGAIASWGDNFVGQCSVPPRNGPRGGLFAAIRSGPVRYTPVGNASCDRPHRRRPTVSAIGTSC